MIILKLFRLKKFLFDFTYLAYVFFKSRSNPTLKCDFEASYFLKDNFLDFLSVTDYLCFTKLAYGKNLGKALARLNSKEEFEAIKIECKNKSFSAYW